MIKTETYSDLMKNNIEERFIEKLQKVHFDVQHNNIIVWETLDKLKEELQNRIEATLGKGNFINKNELSN